jgi:hypothetical protein
MGRGIPKTPMSNGVMRAPPPTPVKPTRNPTAAATIIRPHSMPVSAVWPNKKNFSKSGVLEIKISGILFSYANPDISDYRHRKLGQGW